MVGFQQNQLQLCSLWTHFFIGFLKLFNETATLNDVGGISHIFGPRYEILALP